MLNKAHTECTLLLGDFPVRWFPWQDISCRDISACAWVYTVYSKILWNRQQLRHNIPCLEYDTVRHMTVMYSIVEHKCAIVAGVFQQIWQGQQGVMDYHTQNIVSMPSNTSSGTRLVDWMLILIQHEGWWKHYLMKLAICDTWSKCANSFSCTHEAYLYCWLIATIKC